MPRPEETIMTFPRSRAPHAAPTARPVRTLRTAVAACAALGLVAVLASVSPPVVRASAAPKAAELFRDADLALGEQMIREHKCTECHVRKFGGDGASVYRPRGRISTPGFLRGMVEQCNTELNLGLFPEEVTSVAAVLNRDHYRFD
jgi:hypothetical protein